MKTIRFFSMNTACLAVVGALNAASAAQAANMGTGFNYQGRLVKAGAPVTNTCNMTFRLWDAAGTGSPPVGGSQIGVSQPLPTVSVANGLFTVPLNAGGQFGVNAFNGDARWLEISVQCLGDPVPATLAPRVELKPTPYSLRAGKGVGPPNALEVDTATGNVGIGTINPSSKLEVAGGGDILLRGVTGDAGDLAFMTNTGVQRGRVWTNPAANELFLSSIDLTPDIMIDANGRVGIGTPTPTAKLHVGGTAGVDGIKFPDGTLQKTAGGGTGDGHSLDAADGSPIDAVYVDNDGDVGIGTDNPQYGLDVKASGIRLGLQGNGGGQLVLANNLNDNRIWLEAFNSTGDGSAAELLLTGHGGQPVPQLTLVADTTYASGNVGIGTTGPAGRLHVADSASNADFWLESTNAGTGDRARIFMKTGERQWQIENDGAMDVFKVRDTTALADRLAIDTTGRVGIGTVAPAARLDVVAASMGDGIQVTGAQGVSPGFKLHASWEESFPPFRGPTMRYTGALALATSPGHWSNDARPGDIVLRSVAGETPPIFPPREVEIPTRLILQNGEGPAGLVLSENNVGIGTASPGANLDISSDSTNLTTLNLRNTSADQRYLLQVVGTDHAGAEREGNFEIWATTTDLNSLVFTGTPEGNVGIGMNASDARLSVAGAIAIPWGTELRTTNTGHSARTILKMSWDGSNGDYLDLYTPGAGQADDPKVRINEFGNVGIGTDNPDAKLRVSGGDIRLDAWRNITAAGRLHIQTDFNEPLLLNPSGGETYVGGGGGPGNLFVSGDIKLNAGTIRSWGRLHIQSDPADDNLFLNPWSGTVHVGGGGGPGNLNVAGRVDVGQGIFFPGSYPAVPYAQGGNVISFGHPGVSEDQLVYYDNTFLFVDSEGGGDTRQPTVSVGVLQIRGGADLAEPFDVSGSEVEPGMVVVIDADQPGKLKLSAKAYDRTVAGVVSGAGGVQSGLVMGQEGSVAYGKQNVALTGRVYCWCDASNGAIQPGDLLTTSDTSGHAMKAADRERAHGTIVGKAMTALPQGERGLVLVLVNLQ